MDTKFKLFEGVYLKTDTDQLLRMITGYTVRPDGVQYALVCGTVETWHYTGEISRKKNVVLSTA